MESFPWVKEGSRVHRRRTGQDPAGKWSEIPTEPRPSTARPPRVLDETPWPYGRRPRACSAPWRLREPRVEARRDFVDRFPCSRREPCPSAARPSRLRSGSILPRTHSMRSSVCLAMIGRPICTSSRMICASVVPEMEQISRIRRPQGAGMRIVNFSQTVFSNGFMAGVGLRPGTLDRFFALGSAGGAGGAGGGEAGKGNAPVGAEGFSSPTGANHHPRPEGARVAPLRCPILPAGDTTLAALPFRRNEESTFKTPPHPPHPSTSGNAIFPR